MFKDRTVKKISKKFTNFTEEEQWLQSMLHEGWVLKSYNSEDLDACQYIFEPVQHIEEKNRIYKIDYRNFTKKDDFQEYKDIFEDAGWTAVAKSKTYSKHIFYTDLQNANQNIFSDIESFKEREKRKMSTYVINIIASLLVSATLIILYIIYRRTAMFGAGLFTLASSVKFMIDYYKHRKAYKSLVE